MSSYIHVFARKDDTFIELLSHSGSSVFYRFFHDYAPYGHIARFTENQIREGRSRVQGELELYREDVRHVQELITQIGSWSNTVEEKLSAIIDYQENLHELDEAIDEREFVDNVLAFLLGVDAELYIGVECGDHVTVDDISTQ